VSDEARAPIDLVAEQASAGRGLWIGLFVDPTHELAGQHLTLAHLGKREGAARALRAHDACVNLVANWNGGPIEAATWGQARLDQYAGCASVILLEVVVLRDFREMLLGNLLAKQLTADHRYEFHPHLTIGKHGKDEPVILRARARQVIPLSLLRLVCGESHVNYTL